jgi:hypothetical protein
MDLHGAAPTRLVQTRDRLCRPRRQRQSRRRLASPAQTRTSRPYQKSIHHLREPRQAQPFTRSVKIRTTADYADNADQTVEAAVPAAVDRPLRRTMLNHGGTSSARPKEQTPAGQAFRLPAQKFNSAGVQDCLAECGRLNSTHARPFPTPFQAKPPN